MMPFGYHAKESAAVVIPVAGQIDELLHVLGRLVRGEFEAERAEIGGYHGLQIRPEAAEGWHHAKRGNRNGAIQGKRIFDLW